MSKGEVILLNKTPNLTPSDIFLPASKSESNRAQIISALAGGNSKIFNLSEARDTQIMKALLSDESESWDARDAGTTFRFLTAFAAVSRKNQILTGTPRMQKRPIGVLAEALKSIGAKIEYLGENGYPPLRIRKIENQKRNEIQIQGNISSQYISALMMIAPTLPNGLTLHFTSEITSRPYLEMTASIMEIFGIAPLWDPESITILPGKYQPAEISIESDWSAASYWYAFTALAEEAVIKLDGLRENSFQGDQEILQIMDQIGVETNFSSSAAYLKKKEISIQEIELDFTHCPDLAQTVAVVCAAKGIKCKMTGLQSLKIKETDRIAALQNELGKVGAKFIEDNETWMLIPPINNEIDFSKPVRIETYEDHRMAMAFAPLCTLGNIRIEDPKVVNKSYPGFWKDLQKAGIRVN